MTMPGQFHHVVFDVTDLRRSEQFYGEALGLEPIGSDVFPEDGPSSAFRTHNGHYVVLVQTAEVKPDGPGVHTNFMVSVEDYPVIFERLQQQGSLRGDHRADQRADTLSTYFADPDGRQLQITSISPRMHEVQPSRRGKIAVGRIEDFPVGSVVHSAEGKFFLVRTREGLLAINEICTHQRCNVTYQPEHYRFYCACHYRKFRRNGEQIATDQDVPPLQGYPLEILDGTIVVDTDQTIVRTLAALDEVVPVPAGVS